MSSFRLLFCFRASAIRWAPIGPMVFFCRLWEKIATLQQIWSQPLPGPGHSDSRWEVREYWVPVSTYHSMRGGKVCWLLPKWCQETHIMWRVRGKGSQALPCQKLESSDQQTLIISSNFLSEDFYAAVPLGLYPSNPLNTQQSSQCRPTSSLPVTLHSSLRQTLH